MFIKCTQLIKCIVHFGQGRIGDYRTNVLVHHSTPPCNGLVHINK